MKFFTKLIVFCLGFILFSFNELSAQERNTSFGKKESSGFDLKGKIYAIEKTLPPYSLPEYFEPDSLIGIIYTDQLNIPPTNFRDGFPGVTNRSTWFAIDYSGTFKIGEASHYRFKVKSDDGSRLFIDGEEIIDNDGMHGPKEKEGSVFLEVGNHDIRIKYFQGFPHLLCLQLWVAKGETPFALFDTKNFAEREVVKDFPKKRFILADTLLFASNSYKLSAKASPVLNKLILGLSDTTTYRSIDIIGHTDDVGEEAYNLELSQKRAKSVKAYFEKKGIPSSKIKIEGKGESSPLVENTSAANRAVNRRVEIIVKQQKQIN